MAIIHSMYCEAGKVAIDEKTCVQCGSCAKICPSEVLKMDDGKPQVSAKQDSVSPSGYPGCQ